MISLTSILHIILCEQESVAAEHAHKLGLVSGGWGTWKDSNGNTVAKTVRGQLVKIADLDELDIEDDINDFSQQMRDKHRLKRFELSINRNTGDLRLDMIVVDKQNHGQGSGTAAMEDLVRYADAHGKRMTLSPMEKNSTNGTTSTARLEKFYKRFGFVSNKGRHKDFRTSDTMIRPARASRS